MEQQNKNKGKILSVLLIAVIIGIIIVGFSGCIGEDKQTSDKENKIKIIDQAGREVYVPTEVNRVISLYPEATRVITALDRNKLVGVSNHDKKDTILTEIYPNIKNLPGVGDMKAANVEEIVTLKPDVIFTAIFTSTQADELQELTGIPVICVNIINNETKFSYDIFEVVGKIIGKEERGKHLKKFLEDELSNIKSRTSKISKDKKIKGYMATPENPLKTNIQLDPLDSGGVINVAYDSSLLNKSHWFVLDYERLMILNPDVVFLYAKQNSTKDEILNNPQWSHIKAVKEKKIYKVIVVSYGVHPSMSVINSMQIAKLSYPDKFEDLDVVTEGDKIFKELYGTDKFFSKLYKEWGLDVEASDYKP